MSDDLISALVELVLGIVIISVVTVIAFLVS
jgi:hypothetical protein